jgi:hypothetical protein
MGSGWDMKSVMRSSMLLGSRTKVGKVTLDSSIPTLPQLHVRCFVAVHEEGMSHRSCEMSELTIEPWCSSLRLGYEI